jgi:aspartate aminotransferase
VPDLATARTASLSVPPSPVSTMAAGLVGSEILKIAADIRVLREQGATICNLTVGDFDPAEFRIPEALEEGIVRALRAGETNYPPSAGIPSLREAVRAHMARAFGLDVPVAQVLVTGGSRPGIYGVFRTLVDPGERVVYPVPSWNNNHYVHLVQAEGVPVPCRAADAFLPTRQALASAVRGARLLALNSPLNPAGTAFTATQLGELCDLVLEENARRLAQRAGERPLYLMYDQVYASITFDGVRHEHPVALRPDMAPYTLTVDGISKAFAATGVRVGWVTGPASVMPVMSDVLGHVGAWAPRAEQVATAAFLADGDAVRAYGTRLAAGVRERLGLLRDALEAMRADGLPVESIPAMGAIYLSARFAVVGRTTRDGATLRTNEDIRRWLLAEAGFAAVPFQAFGVREDDGWFRLSVGAVSPQAIREAMPRVRAAVQSLR